MNSKLMRFVCIAVILTVLVVPVSAKTGPVGGGPSGQAAPAPGFSILEDWYEDWDSYPTGQSMHGVGGWKGWGDDPAWTAYTTDVQFISDPNSIDINGDADLVHEYAIDAGVWTYTAWQFMPGDFTGLTYFILLNQYDDAGLTNNWSTQVSFDAASVLNTGISGGSLPVIKDQWVEIRVEIDLDADTQSFYYGGDLLYSGTWTEEVSGGGITSIGAVDLFANAASPVYYDDLSLVEFVEENTMHVEAIDGRFEEPFLVMKVQAADQDGMPLGDVMVDATITMPFGEWMRWRYTKPTGWARFWAPLLMNGNYEICIDNLTLPGYVYNPDDNVVTCMDWDW